MSLYGSREEKTIFLSPELPMIRKKEVDLSWRVERGGERGRVEGNPTAIKVRRKPPVRSRK